MASSKAAFNKALARCERAGWRVERLNSGHVRIYPPTGPVIHTGPPGSGSSMTNILLRLTRAGLDEAEQKSTKPKRTSAKSQPDTTHHAGDGCDPPHQEAAPDELEILDGWAVIQRQPAEIQTPKGMGVLRKAEAVLLEDGTVVFQCLICGEVKPSVYAARTHVGLHTRQERADRLGADGGQKPAPEPTKARGAPRVGSVAPVAAEANGNRSETSRGAVMVRPAAGAVSAPPGMLVHRFPLRTGLVVELWLPADLSAAESVRLAKFVESLVIPQ